MPYCQETDTGYLPNVKIRTSESNSVICIFISSFLSTGNDALIVMQFSTNHKGSITTYNENRKLAPLLFFASTFFIIVSGRITFDRTLPNLHPIFQRKCFAPEHSTLLHLLRLTHVAMSVSPRANLLPILLRRRCSVRRIFWKFPAG